MYNNIYSNGVLLCEHNAFGKNSLLIIVVFDVNALINNE